MKVIRFMAPIFAIGLCASAQGNESHESMARTGIQKLRSAYSVRKSQAVDEIPLACLGEVFVTWYSNYEKVAEQNLGAEVERLRPYVEAKKLRQGHFSDENQIYPAMRPQLITVTRQHLNSLRAQKVIPQVPSEMSLEKYSFDKYIENLEQCMSPTYYQEVARLAPPAEGLKPETLISGSEFTISFKTAAVYSGGSSGSASSVGFASPAPRMVQVPYVQELTGLKKIKTHWMDSIRLR